MSSNGIHSNRPTFSTFPLWGKLFSDVSNNPLSNTGEKIADAQKLLTQLRKSQIENIVTVEDQDEKQIITAQFDAEIKRVIETLQLGYRDYPLLDTKMVINDKGEPVHQLIRRPATNELAVTDFLNFTIHKSTFDSVKKEKLNIYIRLMIMKKALSWIPCLQIQIMPMPAVKSFKIFSASVSHLKCRMV
jgi:phage replication initiation protein